MGDQIVGTEYLADYNENKENLNILIIVRT